MELIIDDEIAALIPPLLPEERSQLEASIVAEGCRDALLIWQETDILLDGHNRYEICQGHGIPFETVALSFNTKNEAKVWVIKNQLGRRNLILYQRSLLALELEDIFKERAKEQQLAGLKKGDAPPPVLANLPKRGKPIDTREEIAEVAHVSGRTIHKVKYLKAHADKETKTRLREDEISVSRAYEELKPAQAVNATVFSSESNEYYTPSHILEAARELMGVIDLDPASCRHAQETVKAAEFFSEDDDGLSRDWWGHVWLNPPYGKIGSASSQGHWAQNLIKEYESGRVTEAVLLVKAAVGYEWFEALWDLWPVCFARQRLSFLRFDGSDDGQSKQGTAFFYFGDHVEKFSEVFGRFGRIFLPEAIR